MAERGACKIVSIFVRTRPILQVCSLVRATEPPRFSKEVHSCVPKSDAHLGVGLGVSFGSNSIAPDRNRYREDRCRWSISRWRWPVPSSQPQRCKELDL